MEPKNKHVKHSDADAEQWLEVVKKKVAQLRYGSVLITIHDGRVAQVESMERTRFNTPPSKSSEP